MSAYRISAYPTSVALQSEFGHIEWKTHIKADELMIHFENSEKESTSIDVQSIASLLVG